MRICKRTRNKVLKFCIKCLRTQEVLKKEEYDSLKNLLYGVYRDLNSTRLKSLNCTKKNFVLT